jgi:hypothetical protein
LAGAAGADGGSKITWKVTGASGQGVGGCSDIRITNMATAMTPACSRHEPAHPKGRGAARARDRDSTGRDNSAADQSGSAEAGSGEPSRVSEKRIGPSYR